MTSPGEIIGREAIAALRANGWIVVRHDAIRLAQAHARDEARTELEELDAEAEKWRDLCFKRGSLLDEIGRPIWEAAAARLEKKAA